MRHPATDFGRVSPENAQTFLAIMQVLHGEPTAPAFGRLLQKRLESNDYVLLAHVFEEISALALHHLVPEALLFDAFAFDLYWDELREDVAKLRAATGNEKFCENFEIAAERAREYRADRPPKTRWKQLGEGENPPPTPGGLRGPTPDRPRPDPSAAPRPDSFARASKPAGGARR